MWRIASFITISLIFFSCNNGTENKQASNEPASTATDAAQITGKVRDAYIHFFPVVENYKAMYAYAIDSSSPKYLGLNHPYNNTVLYSPADKFVVSPNNDTYYTTATLDLRAEPFIIKVPAITDRYYSFQLNSMMTDNFGYIGTNTTGTAAGVYAITSPGYTGKLPDGVKEFKSPSELVGLIGRTAVNVDNPADIKKAKAVQASYQMGGLSRFYPEIAPAKVAPIPFPLYTEASKSNASFFNLLNFLLGYVKLSADEQKILEQYADIGIQPGKPYRFYDENPSRQPAIQEGISQAVRYIDSSSKKLGEVKNGWMMYPRGEYFGTNYKDRTNIAKVGIYANSPFEAYYPMAFVDGEGNSLDGKNNYSITFPKGELPPAKYFWSLTMYDNATQLLSENELKRYSIGDRTKSMKPNADGSLTIYLGHQVPLQGKGNWLPAPASGFNVMMRLYGPGKQVLNGSWAPPPIVRIK